MQHKASDEKQINEQLCCRVDFSVSFQESWPRASLVSKKTGVGPGEPITIYSPMLRVEIRETRHTVEQITVACQSTGCILKGSDTTKGVQEFLQTRHDGPRQADILYVFQKWSNKCVYGCLVKISECIIYLFRHTLGRLFSVPWTIASISLVEPFFLNAPRESLE